MKGGRGDLRGIITFLIHDFSEFLKIIYGG